MPSTTHTPQNDRSLMALFSDLLRETSSLVHNEAELAKVEISEKVSQVGNGLAEHADWLAPLIVGVVVMVLGFVALQRGRRNVKPDNLAPERTMESLRRDAQMVKGHAS